MTSTIMFLARTAPQNQREVDLRSRRVSCFDDIKNTIKWREISC